MSTTPSRQHANLTDSAGRPPRDGQAYRAWAAPPGRDPRELTHAVDPGGRVALCGVRTTVTGGAWPDTRAGYDPVSAWCATCARQVFGKIR